MTPSERISVPLGSIVATPAVLEALTRADIVTALRRHAAGDLGDVTPDDRNANDEALRSGDRQGMNFKGGVVVSSVEPGSFADDIGISKGDVIIELNRQAVSSPEDIRRIQATLKPGDAVVFHLESQTPGRNGSGSWVSRFASGTVPPTQ